jgi:hypothetical protein
MKKIIHYFCKWTGIFLLIIGACCLWDALGDGNIPRNNNYSRSANPSLISHYNCAQVSATNEERWEGLSTALAILHEVNPTVETWVIQKHEENKIVFSDGKDNPTFQFTYIAAYDRFSRKLKISRLAFTAEDGQLAQILCHEYRHSRQNFGKFMIYTLSFVFRRGDDSIVENDAYLYEREASEKIYGTHSKVDTDILVKNLPD